MFVDVETFFFDTCWNAKSVNLVEYFEDNESPVSYTHLDVYKRQPAFIVDDTLCIPTVFIAYTGEALDYKAPLLKALRAVDKAATAVCHYFNPEVKKVVAYLGWEQEYFLVDEGLYAARPDLLMTGRTLMAVSYTHLEISAISFATTIVSV